MDKIISLLRSIEDATGKLIKIDDNTLSKENTYSSSKIVSLLANAGFAVKIVSELPSEGDNNTIYFLAAEDSSEGNTYDEYMYIDQKFEKIGSTSIDLSDYVKLEDFNTALQGKQDTLTIGDGLSLSGSTLSVNRNLSGSYTLSNDIYISGNGESFIKCSPGTRQMMIGTGSLQSIQIGAQSTQNIGISGYYVNLTGNHINLTGSNVNIGKSTSGKVNISGDTRITGMSIYLYAQTGSRYDQAISLTGGGIYMTGNIQIYGSSNGYSSLSASGLSRISLDASYGTGGISLYGNDAGLNLYAGGSVYLTGKSIHLTGSGGSMNITSGGDLNFTNISGSGLIVYSGALSLKGSKIDVLSTSGSMFILSNYGKVTIQGYSTELILDSESFSIGTNRQTFSIGQNYIWSTTGNLYLGGSRTVHLAAGGGRVNIGSDINIANTQPFLTSEVGIESLLCIKGDKVYRVTLTELKKALNNIIE